MDEHPIQGGVEMLLVLYVLFHVTETGDTVSVGLMGHLSTLMQLNAI